MKAKKIILVFLKLAVSSLLLFLLISRIGHTSLYEVLKNAEPLTVFSASILYIVATYISAIRWRILTFSNLSNKRLFVLYMIGSFFNTLLPGIIGGDAVKAYYLYKETGNPGISMASVFMDRYIGFVSLVGIVLFVMPFGVRFIKDTELAIILPLTILAFVVGSIVFFKLRIGSRIKLFRDFYSFFNLYRDLEQTGFLLLNGLILSVIIQLMNMTGVYIIARGIGISISPVAILIFVPIIVTVSMIPVSISGLGVREAAFVILFGKIGIAPESALGISLLWFISVVLGSLPGLVFYGIYSKAEKLSASSLDK